MPAPRFERLPLERRRHILAVARKHVARDGPDGASYNQIIAEAGISKTTAYLYFDGKEDIVAEVFSDLGKRLSELLGEWRPARSSRTFWSQLQRTSALLRAHLASNPDDLGLLGRLPPGVELLGGDAWLEAVLKNGQELEIIREDVPPTLLTAATRAVLTAGDRYVVERMMRQETIDETPIWALLRGLWRPARTSKKRAAAQSKGGRDE